VRLVASAIAFVFTLLVLSISEFGHPHGPLVIVGYIVVPLTIGALASWWALPLTTAGFVLASLVFQLTLWRDDPDLTGIDDLPPLAGILFVLPFILVLVALGAALRHLRVDPANRD
jgi:hypothetical protein